MTNIHYPGPLATQFKLYSFEFVLRDATLVQSIGKGCIFGHSMESVSTWHLSRGESSFLNPSGARRFQIRARSRALASRGSSTLREGRLPFPGRCRRLFGRHLLICLCSITLETCCGYGYEPVIYVYQANSSDLTRWSHSIPKLDVSGQVDLRPADGWQNLVFNGSLIPEEISIVRLPEWNEKCFS